MNSTWVCEGGGQVRGGAGVRLGEAWGGLDEVGVGVVKGWLEVWRQVNSVVDQVEGYLTLRCHFTTTSYQCHPLATRHPLHLIIQTHPSTCYSPCTSHHVPSSSSPGGRPSSVPTEVPNQKESNYFSVPAILSSRIDTDIATTTDATRSHFLGEMSTVRTFRRCQTPRLDQVLTRVKVNKARIWGLACDTNKTENFATSLDGPGDECCPNR